MLREIFAQVDEPAGDGLGFDFGNDSWVADKMQTVLRHAREGTS